MDGQQLTLGYGLCACGCGARTTLAKQTDSRNGPGTIKGEPLRWAGGHYAKSTVPEYVVEDSGHSTPCWVWQRATSWGYGVMSVAGKTRRAHRVYYERYVGPIPDELELDHLCRVRACVNPDHLEAVTHQENMRRADAGKYQSLRTHCPAGHPRNAENTGRDGKGKCFCKICKRESNRRETARRTAARRAAKAKL